MASAIPVNEVEKSLEAQRKIAEIYDYYLNDADTRSEDRSVSIRQVSHVQTETHLSWKLRFHLSRGLPSVLVLPDSAS